MKNTYLYGCKGTKKNEESKVKSEKKSMSIK